MPEPITNPTTRTVAWNSPIWRLRVAFTAASPRAGREAWTADTSHLNPVVAQGGQYQVPIALGLVDEELDVLLGGAGRLDA